MAANISVTSPVAESFVVTDATSVSAVANTIYLCNAGSTATYTLPNGMPAGSILSITRINAGNWVIAQQTGQQIFFGSSNTTASSGTLTSTAAGDSILLVTPDGARFQALAFVGNLTVT